ncbi:MAG: acyl-CoA dehydratase activase [Thermodesulfobacteriota bacterium]|nr:acyl-CoA dehydratase activase [Thermodesulfobacteriota bacterium]
MQRVFSGVDVGASHTKVAILNTEQQMIGHAVRKSGTDFEQTAEICLKFALEMADASPDDIVRCVSTGYGRKNVSFSHETKTEIGCHAKGCYYYYPMAITVIDIGGQDNKVIKVDDQGRRLSFKMNRKCAAGTGAFLEEMSLRLGVALEDMDSLAGASENMVELGSYCTVFSATEVLEKIRQGRKVPDIVKGVFFSVITRILEMDSLMDRAVMTGGMVAHNPYLVKMVKDITGQEILVPEFPQLTGSIGAALFAMENEKVNVPCPTD